jgi:hypothetical protein
MRPHARVEFAKRIKIQGPIIMSSITSDWYGVRFPKILAFEAALQEFPLNIARDIGAQVHWGDLRKVSPHPPYFYHPPQVGWRCFEVYPKDKIIIAAALLHDVYENAPKYIAYLSRELEKYKQLPETNRKPEEFFKNHATPLFLEFLNAKYNEKFDVKDEAALLRLEEFLRNPNIGKAYTSHIKKKIRKEIGWTVFRIVRLLTRETNELNYKSSFLKHYLWKGLRSRAASIKCLDAIHNLATLDIEGNPKHAAKTICRIEDSLDVLRDAGAKEEWYKELCEAVKREEANMIALGKGSFLEAERARRKLEHNCVDLIQALGLLKVKKDPLKAAKMICDVQDSLQGIRTSGVREELYEDLCAALKRKERRMGFWKLGHHIAVERARRQAGSAPSLPTLPVQGNETGGAEPHPA